MMVTKQMIVDQARTYLGVKWHHQGRSTAGMDCAGLVLQVAHDFGLTDFDTFDYGRTPNANLMKKTLDEHAVYTMTPEPGDILLMRFTVEPQHVAIMTDIGIIHCCSMHRKVTEHRLDDLWNSRIVCAYEYRGVTRG